MKLLTDFHVSFLDDLISPPIQSVVFELVVWATVWLLFCQLTAPPLRRYLRSVPAWKLAKKRVGIFMENGQDDMVLIFLFGVHHFVAGSLMVAGYVGGDDNPSLFRHGYLLECGFEFGDLLSMLFKIYPYQLHDGMKPEMIPALIFHHSPGVLLCFPIVLSGLYENENLQVIAIDLLIGAAVSCVFGNYLYQLDVEKHMVRATVAFCTSVSFFIYCRWYIFPLFAWRLIQDVKTHETLGDSKVVPMLYAAGVVFSLFNVAITADLLPTALRFVQCCFDETKILEPRPIPSTRDSRVLRSYQQGTYQGRRSTILNLLGDVVLDEQGHVHRRRTSILKAALVGSPQLEDLLPALDEMDVNDGSQADNKKQF